MVSELEQFSAKDRDTLTGRSTEPPN